MSNCPLQPLSPRNVPGVTNCPRTDEGPFGCVWWINYPGGQGCAVLVIAARLLDLSALLVTGPVTAPRYTRSTFGDPGPEPDVDSLDALRYGVKAATAEEKTDPDDDR